MKVVAIQARMGSSRVPGKVLRDIAGRPLLERLVARVRLARGLDGVVIAATEDPRDDELETFGERLGLTVHRGSTEDIISRLRGAADVTGATVIVRVWGDSPLLDPRTIEAALAAFDDAGLGYVNTYFPRRTFPAGFDLEAYRGDVLRAADDELKDLYLREFPFEHMTAQRGWRWKQLSHPTDYSALRATVDYPEDVEAVSGIFRHFEGRGMPGFGVDDVAAYLLAHPSASSAPKPLNVDYAEKKRQREGG